MTLTLHQQIFFSDFMSHLINGSRNQFRESQPALIFLKQKEENFKKNQSAAGVVEITVF